MVSSTIDSGVDTSSFSVDDTSMHILRIAADASFSLLYPEAGTT